MKPRKPAAASAGHRAAQGKAPNPEAMAQELRQLFATGDHARLERKAREQVSRTPDFAFGWKVLSIAQLLQGRDAVAASQRAVQLLPGDAEAYNNLAKALMDAGRAGDSKDACLQALQLDGRFAMAHNNLGIAWRQLGDLDKARAAYEQALLLAPGLPDAALNLGHLLANAGQADQAIDAYRRAFAAFRGCACGHL